ncbi:MAG: D-alanyl-D-alanine carboxypeptidase/D-alanyl-D-alanine-endopeptidase, partial [Chlamydiae bacterium]|nr:D-alanyl-D-alanine carboxypeptidase/D-alanyl-D-alanine-endopeptidase [Chlamydiota bacterium]
MITVLRGVLICLSISYFIYAMDSGDLEELPRVRLQKELKEVVFHADETAVIGVKVVSLTKGETLFEMNEHQSFIPGSAIKIFTAATAFKVLGPDFCFDTKLSSDGVVDAGVLKGNLYVEGSGDPSLKDDAFEEMIFQMKLRNIREIEGDLVFDATEFDDIALGPGWMWDEKLESRNSAVDALTMNHSFVKIWVKPGDAAMKSPFILMQPEIPGVIIENHATMEEIEPCKTLVSVIKRGVMDKDILRVDGKMSLKNDMLQFKVPVNNPQLYTATEFLIKLKNHQIKHSGKVRFEKTPEEVKVLATHRSEPLKYLVMYMLKNNDDLYANCLFKKIGRLKYGKPGTWSNGGQSVRDLLIMLCQKDYNEVTVLDGSGESRHNRLTPHIMTSFLEKLYQDCTFSLEFIAALPVAG